MKVMPWLTVAMTGDSLAFVGRVREPLYCDHNLQRSRYKTLTQPEIDGHSCSRDDRSGTPGVGGGKSAANFTPSNADVALGRPALEAIFKSAIRSSIVSMRDRPESGQRQQDPDPVGLDHVLCGQDRAHSRIFHISRDIVVFGTA